MMKLEERVTLAKSQVKELYLEDDLPWIVGFSGGKDSTTVLQLVWDSVAEIPEEKRTKAIHVISTDTLVENPAVSALVQLSLVSINVRSKELRMKIQAHALTPALEDRFWVNLIGRGYPAPRPKFRWCTSRLKINPSTKFLRDLSEHTEAILFLGTRSSESDARRQSMERHKGSTRALLSKNGDASLDRVWIFPLIGDWDNGDVWEYLLTYKNPWRDVSANDKNNPDGNSNLELFELYKGATPDAECPLVVDTNTPSCGDSRFGCYVCTMVDKDKSLSAMITNVEDKKWMIPLAEFREKSLPTDDDFKFRDFRRMDGNLTVFSRATDVKGERVNALVHGPYTQEYREKLLRDLLTAQTLIRRDAPAGLENFQTISMEEIEEIRRIWIEEKHEIEDSVPLIYEEVTGGAYPAARKDYRSLFGIEELELLKQICTDSSDPGNVHYRMLREMLHIEQSYKGASRRVGIYGLLEKSLKKHAFVKESDALEFALSKKDPSELEEEVAK